MMFLLKKDENAVKPAQEKKKALDLKQLGLMKAIYFGGLLSKDLSPTAKLVLQGLAYHYNPKKNFMFPSQKFLGEQLGMSTRSIERAIKELKTQGLIDYETKKVNFYFFTAKFWGLIEDSFKIEEEQNPLTESKESDTRQNVGGENGATRQNVGGSSVKMSDDTRQNVGQTCKEQENITKENLLKERYKKERIKKADNWRSAPEGITYLPFEPVERVWDENNPKNHLKTARAYVKGLWALRENVKIKQKIEEIVEIWGEQALFAEDEPAETGS